MVAVEDGGGGIPADGVLGLEQSGGGDAGSVGDQDGRGPLQAGEGLTQEPSGMDVAIAEGLRGVDQDEVEVALGSAVLEAVIQEKAGDLGLAAQDRRGGGDAIGIGFDDDSRQRVGQDGLFVTDLRAGLSVAAQENGRALADLLELGREPLDDGSLAGSARGDVADADGGPAKVVPAAAVVSDISAAHGEGIGEFGKREQAAGNGG